MKCEYCDEEIGKRSKILITLCKSKGANLCSMECYNNCEVEGLFGKAKDNEESK